MPKTAFGNYDIGGSIFWILLSLLSLGSLIFLLIWSFHNNSVKGVVIGVIFISMIFAGLIFSKLKVFDYKSWGDNTLSFTIGFAAWMFIGGVFGSQSVLSVSQNQLFASIASELPQFLEFSANVFLVPIAEEFFWMIAIPYALYSIMGVLAKKWSIWRSKLLNIVVIALVAALTFGFFHVGRTGAGFLTFLFAAMIFRIIMIVLVYGDEELDIIQNVNLVAGFAVGAHIANNLMSSGLGNGLLLIKTNFWPAGLFILLIMGLFLGSGIVRLINLIVGNKQKVAL